MDSMTQYVNNAVDSGARLSGSKTDHTITNFGILGTSLNPSVPQFSYL